MATGKKPGPARVNVRPVRGRPPLDETERRRILDATTAVFLEKGFERASTAEIARRAHTSKQTLYSLFPAKADLFVAVMSAHTEQLFSHHMVHIESKRPPRRALTEIGRMTLRMFSAPTFVALYRILVSNVEKFPDLARQLWRVCQMRGNELLAEYLESRRIGGPAYRESAAQFISFVLGDYVINAMLNPDLEMSERMLRARVRNAVNDFLRLHPAQLSRKKACQ
ncbi:MAG: TetR/AcrR family transcriptional regulator [Terracidiphilus sp.]|jgi:AcrR family transcriptional regulator